MNAEQFVLHVEARVGPREYTGVEPEELEDFINACRHRAAREAYQEGERGLVEAVFDLTVDAANKKASFSSNADLLPAGINEVRHATVDAGVGLPFELLDSVGDLQAVAPDSELAYAAVGDNAVYYAYPAGNLANGSTLKVRGPKVPALGSWPAQLEDRLIDAGVELYLERKKALPPEEVGSGVKK